MTPNRDKIDVDALYAEHCEGVLLFLARRTGEPDVALDLWAETFARALQGRQSYRGSTPEEAAGWIYGIARKLLANYHRRGEAEHRAVQRLRLERPPASPEVLADLERRAELAAMRAALAAALAELTPAVREAVEQRVVAERPYSEIAHSLGTTEQAVRARVSRGLSALADALDPTTPSEVLRP